MRDGQEKVGRGWREGEGWTGKKEKKKLEEKLDTLPRWGRLETSKRPS